MKKKIFLSILLIISTIIFIVNISRAENENVLESKKYLILEEKGYISRIVPETELAEFRQKFNIGEETVHVYKDSNLKEEITEGYIKTGMIATFDGMEEKYQLIVIGDLNSDGLMDQIDLNLLIKHVIGMKDFQQKGLPLIASDISKDSKTNQTDITLLIRYIMTHELYIPEIERPVEPTIEIVKGKEGENNWYISDVQAQINEAKDSKVKIGKTIYKVSGKTTIEETEIKNGNKINLTEDGEYKITAYSYSTEGAKSKIATKTIKIDKTAPEVGIEASEKNKTIEVKVNAEDNMSGIKNYKYYIGKKENENIVYKEARESEENTYTFTELKRNEDYYIKVEVYDNAGNVKTSSEEKYHTQSIPELYDDKKAEEKGTEPNVKVEKSEEDWTNEDVIIKIKLDEDVDPEDKYDLEYSKDGGETWEPYNPDDGIRMEENGDVEVRLTDKEDDGEDSGEGITITVDNIDKIKPEADMTAIPTQDKIIVKVNATDEPSGVEKYKYYIGKKNEDGEIEWKDPVETENNKITFEDLEPNNEYIVKVEVIDKAGNVTEVQKEVKTLEEGTSGQFISLVQDNKKWTNRNVTVTITSNTDEYKTEYSLDGETWKEFENQEKVEFSENGNIYARTLDGEDIVEVGSLTIQNIDKKEPNATINICDITSRSFNAKINMTDDISGIAKLIWYYKPANDKKVQKDEYNYVVIGSTNRGELKQEETFEYKDLISGKYWVCAEITDAAGNTTITETIYAEPETITSGEDGITINLDKTFWTNQDIKVTATNNDDRYTIQISKDGENWEDADNVTMTENDSVYIRLTDGINAGEPKEVKVKNIDKQNASAEIWADEITSKSFKVKVDVKDELSGLGQIKWYYKEENNDEYTEVVENYQTINGEEAGENDTVKEFTRDNLPKGTYKVYAVITDVAGNEITTEEVTIELLTITAGNATIRLEPNNTNYTNQDIEVTAINSDDTYTVQVSTDGENWENADKITRTENGKVYARLTDGVNYGEKTYIEINNIDKEETTATLTNTGVTSKTLEMQVNVTDNLSGLGKIDWYIKKKTEAEWKKVTKEYKDINGSEAGDLTATKENMFEDLTSGEYQVYSIITDVAGNKTLVDSNGSRKINDDGVEPDDPIESTLTTITSGEDGIIITSENENWTDENVTLTSRTTDDRYTILTSKDGENWTADENVEFTENGTLYAKLTDGINTGEPISKQVGNIDKEQIQVTTNMETKTSRSFTVKVDTTDNLSGLAKIEVYYRKVGETDYKVETANYQAIKGRVAGDLTASKNILIDGLTYGEYEYYTVITDVAGNETTVEATETVTLTKITAGNETITLEPNNTNWTNNPVIINATNSDTRYTIQLSKDGENWEDVDSITVTENGTVYARLTDGINYGEYATIEITNIDTTKPTGTVQLVDKTSKTMNIKVLAEDERSGIASITYYYNLPGEAAQSKTIPYKTVNGNETGDLSVEEQQLFENLKNGTYTVWAVITDVAGNQTTTEKIQVELDTITSGNVALTLTPSNTNWTKETVTVNVTSTDTKYDIQISTDGTNWETKNEITVNANGTIYARLYDGINGGEYATYTVGNIDTEDPTITTNLSGTPSSTSINLSVGVTDSTSGISEIIWYYKESSSSGGYSSTKTTYKEMNGSQAGETTTVTKTKQITGLTAGTTYSMYAVIYDVAGNSKQTDTISLKCGSEPTITASYSSKTTDSITVSAKGEDVDGGTLTYRLYTSTSENSGFTQKASTTGNAGNTVSLTASSLSMYTKYYWYVTVTDDTSLSGETSKSNVRTYCSGKTDTCTTSYCSGGNYYTCSSCRGTGTASGGCSSCSGTGKVACNGTWGSSGMDAGWCSVCHEGNVTGTRYYCLDCGASYGSAWCESCGGDYYSFGSSSHGQINCSTCSGSGTVSVNCSTCRGSGHDGYYYCSHDKWPSHYYCDHGTDIGATSHYYCSHNANGTQHD